jgi:hypothetical protein
MASEKPMRNSILQANNSMFNTGSVNDDFLNSGSSLPHNLTKGVATMSGGAGQTSVGLGLILANEG